MIKTLTLTTLLAFSLHIQAASPAFEVASITPCPPGTPAPPAEHSGTVQWVFPGGRFEAKATTLRFLLEWAYQVQPAQHSRGPAWTETDRYDILAKTESNATEQEMRKMVQALLAERFHLKLHTEKKEQSVLVILLGKSTPKLYPPKDGEVHGLQMAPLMDANQKFLTYRVTATRFSLTELADTLSRQLGRAMVNKTGLEGEFDFTLDITPEEGRPKEIDSSILITAINDLGLTLKAETALADFLVIDGADKVAVGN